MPGGASAKFGSGSSLAIPISAEESRPSTSRAVLSTVLSSTVHCPTLLTTMGHAGGKWFKSGNRGVVGALDWSSAFANRPTAPAMCPRLHPPH